MPRALPSSQPDHPLAALDRNYPAEIGRLTPPQVRSLQQIAHQPESFAQPSSAPRAIEALARGARPEVAGPVLARVVVDTSATLLTRITAARELGAIGKAVSERALLGVADVEHPRVQVAVLRAVGLIGGEAALRRLLRIPEPSDAAARRQLEFTCRLIAHRLGVESPIPLPHDVVRRQPERVGMRTQLAISFTTAAATEKARRRLTGPTFGIRFAPRAASIRCGGAESLLFLNRDLDLPRLSKRLRERPGVLGLIAAWPVYSQRAVVRQLLLTSPEENGARVDIFRRNGELLCTGRLTIDGLAVRFTIGDVSGRITTRAIELD